MSTIRSAPDPRLDEALRASDPPALSRPADPPRCAGCGLVATAFLPDADGLPHGWAKAAGELRCLACRRAGVLGRARAEADTSGVRRWGAQTHARRALVAFEIERDADRPDGVIAKATETNIATVKVERSKLLAEGRIEPRRSGPKVKQ